MVDKKHAVVKRVEHLKALLNLQTKISDFIASPGKVKKLVDSFGEEVDPKYYELVHFYFDRIPELKPYRPVDTNKYRRDQAKFMKLQMEQGSLMNELKEWSFLPYSEHRDLGVLSMDMRLTLDAVNAKNARKIEEKVKKQFISRKVKEMADEYRAAFPQVKASHQFEKELEDYISEYTTSIIERRTQLMLQSKPQVMEIILEHMRRLSSSDQAASKYSHSDFLPFADIIPNIVATMDKHPIRPQLSFVNLSKE